MNELWIYDVIGESFFDAGVTDKSVRDELKKFKSTDPLDVRINSPGGNVSHAVAIKTMIDQWKGPVNIQIDGLAASAASYIAMANATVSIAEGSQFMIHNPWSMAVGDAREMRKNADFLDKVGNSLQKAYADRTGLSVKELSEMMDEETWMDADEAVAAGFVHSLIEEHQAAAFVVPAAMGFKNVPRDIGVAAAVKRPNNELDAMKRRMQLVRSA